MMKVVVMIVMMIVMVTTIVLIMLAMVDIKVLVKNNRAWIMNDNLKPISWEANQFAVYQA